jgi:hypothetical protein
MPNVIKNNQLFELVEVKEEFIPIGNSFFMTPDINQKLLLRRTAWLAPGNFNCQIQMYGPTSAGLSEYFLTDPSNCEWFCPATSVAYEEDGLKTSSFYEQDVSNFNLPFLEYVKSLVIDGGPTVAVDICNVFAEACDSLLKFSAIVNPKFVPQVFQGGEGIYRSGGPNITLQNFASFYVNRNNKVVLMDAGFVIPDQMDLNNLNPKKLELINPGIFKNVFAVSSNEPLNGLRIRLDNFRYYHALMLRGAFFNCCEYISKQPNANSFIAKLNQTKIAVEALIKTPPNKTAMLDDLKKVLSGVPGYPPPPPRDGGKSQDPVKQTTQDPVKQTTVDKRGPGEKNLASWPLSAKLTSAFLVLAALCMLFFLIYPKSGGFAEPPPNYFVVFPSKNSDTTLIFNSLKESFKNEDSQGNDSKLQLIQADPAKRQKLLDDKLKASLSNFSNPAETKDLIDLICKNGNIKFFGFESDQKDPVVALTKFLEQNSVGDFSPVDTNSNLNGSLLQSSSKNVLLGLGKLKGDSKAGKLLDDLRQIALDQTAYKELLETIGDKTAIVIDGKKHPDARSKLLSRLAPPEFAALPTVAKFSTVGRTSEIVEGLTGFLSLVVPQKCYWRQIGLSNRAGIQIEPEDLEKTKWREFVPPEKIRWVPISVVKDSQSVTFNSFDIAIPIEATGKVVLFRNQTLYSRKTRELVQYSITKYLTDKLNIPADKAKDFFNVNQNDQGFFGTISYTSLAQSLTVDNADVEILSNVDFKTKSESEDTVLVIQKIEEKAEKENQNKDGM